MKQAQPTGPLQAFELHEFPSGDQMRFSNFQIGRIFLCGLFLATTVLHIQPLFAMQFSFKHLTSGPQSGAVNGVRMEGTIEPGDYERLVNFVRSAPYDFITAPNVYLDSNGGSVVEALKIAELVKLLYMQVVISRTSVCLSSCFYIYAGAVKRLADPDSKVGLHRPYYRPADFGKLTPTQAERKYKELDSEVRDFLASVGLPIRYIEKMFSVSSREMYLLTFADLMAVGTHASWYEELTIATCGADPTKSRKYPSIEAYSLAIKEYDQMTYRCMGRAVTSDQGKVIDRILGDKSWRSK